MRFDLRMHQARSGELKPKVKYKRAGTIFYTNFPCGSVLFCFGVDRVSGDYSDWGGSIKKNETEIKCAIRETYEETRGCISLSESDFNKNLYISSEEDMAISFLVKIDYKKLMSFPIDFAFSKFIDYEMKSIKIMTLEDIQDALIEKKFYSVIDRAIQKTFYVFNNLNLIVYSINKIRSAHEY
jgi:hypothetical protein